MCGDIIDHSGSRYLAQASLHYSLLQYVEEKYDRFVALIDSYPRHEIRLSKEPK